MKHLKEWKLFENKSDFEEIKSTLKDLCLDLTDEYYRIMIAANSVLKSPNWSLYPGRPRYILGISKEVEYFNFSDIKDVILNVKDYLGDKYMGCGVVFVGDPNRIKIDINFEDYDQLDQMFTTDEAPIVNLVIYFNI
jgi:hypothetical protein